MKILVAEDDTLTRRGIIDILKNEGYEVAAAADGDEALKLFSDGSDEKPDLIILDIMMPKVNGYDVCRAIRSKDQKVPVIFLSAKSEEIDKVLGLELGADDYISKPFGVKEMVARVRAVYRRVYMNSRTGAAGAGAAEDSPFEIGDLTVYPAELKAVRGNDDIDLSVRDVKVLSIFAAHRGKVLDRDAIYNAGWGESHLPNSRTLDQHISQLRKKIEADPKNPCIIVTVHTAGYRYP